MAATGKEVPTYDQLLMYVAYATDEELEEYLNCGEPYEPGEFTITSSNSRLIFSNTTCTADSNGHVIIEPSFESAYYSVVIDSGNELFTIPAKYAPSTTVTGQITHSGEIYDIELDSSGTVTYTESTRFTMTETDNAASISIEYDLTIVKPNLTGREVLRLSQVKAYLGDGGGGGSSGPTWTTAWTGTYQCSASDYLNISTSSFGYGTTSKMRVTASYSIYGNIQDSGTYEITVPSSLPNASYMSQRIGEFIIDNQTFAVGAYAYDGYVYLKFVCTTTDFTPYCAISKIEVM